MKAGFGKVEITPRVGVELCGFGPYLCRSSTRVIEPLWARALAVEQGGQRWVLVSCDLIAVNTPTARRVRALVRAATGLRDEQIMVHCTHNHCGPCTLPELIGWGAPDELYFEILPHRIAQAGVEAVRDLRDAEVHHAEVEATGFSYNRELPDPGRTNDAVLAGQWITDKPEETDTSAHVLRIDRGGKLAGFVSYFSCHPVVCCAKNREIHGDYVGVATNRIEREHPGAVGLFLQGAHGDINPAYVHGPAEQSLQALEMFGGRFADVIRLGVEKAQPMAVDRLASAESNEPYTLANLSEKELRQLLAEKEKIVGEHSTDADPLQAQTHEVGLAMVFVTAIRGTLARMARGEKLDRPLIVQALRLGPVTFTANTMETFNRIKRRFQAERDRRALLLSVTNGFIGYAPVRDLYRDSKPHYASHFVPYMLGTIPFTERIEDEVLTAALKVTERV